MNRLCTLITSNTSNTATTATQKPHTRWSGLIGDVDDDELTDHTQKKYRAVELSKIIDFGVFDRARAPAEIDVPWKKKKVVNTAVRSGQLFLFANIFRLGGGILPLFHHPGQIMIINSDCVTTTCALISLRSLCVQDGCSSLGEESVGTEPEIQFR